jgi:hypothetical protein
MKHFFALVIINSQCTFCLKLAHERVCNRYTDVPMMMRVVQSLIIFVAFFFGIQFMFASWVPLSKVALVRKLIT